MRWLRYEEEGRVEFNNQKGLRKRGTHFEGLPWRDFNFFLLFQIEVNSEILSQLMSYNCFLFLFLYLAGRLKKIIVSCTR